MRPAGIIEARLRIYGMTKNRPSFDVTGELASMRRYALVLTRDPADAEDLVQEALVRAYDRRSTFRADAALRPWLLSILHNCFVDGVRRRRTEAAVLAIASSLAESQQPAPQDHQIRLTQLRQNFMALPEEQRAALHLVAIEGLSYHEASTALGIPAGTLMSRLARARAALRAIEDSGTNAASAPQPNAGPRLRLVGGSDDTSG